MRRLAAIVLLLAACAPKDGDHVDCDLALGCSQVQSTLATGEATVDLLEDGNGGVYAALLGARDNPVCTASAICHGAIWRIDRNGDVSWKVGERTSVTRPIRIDGGVAYRTGDGRLEAVNASGSRRWSLDVGDPNLVASAWGNTLYVVGGGQVRKVDVATGAVTWTQPFAVTVPAEPVRGPFAQQVVVAGLTVVSSSNKVLARSLDPADGGLVWEAVLPANLSAPAVLARGRATPFPEPGPILLVSDRLSLRDPEGDEIWGVNGVEGFRRAVPTVDDGWAALGPLVSNVTRFRKNGTVLWSQPLTAAVNWIAVAPDGNLLAGQQDGVLRKLDVDSGISLWTYGGVDQVKAFAPPVIASNGSIVLWGANVGDDSDTSLSVVSQAGSSLDRWNVESRISSVALSDDLDVFVAVTDGRLYLRSRVDF